MSPTQTELLEPYPQTQRTAATETPAARATEQQLAEQHERGYTLEWRGGELSMLVHRDGCGHRGRPGAAARVQLRAQSVSEAVEEARECGGGPAHALGCARVNQIPTRRSARA